MLKQCDLLSNIFSASLLHCLNSSATLEIASNAIKRHKSYCIRWRSTSRIKTTEIYLQNVRRLTISMIFSFLSLIIICSFQIKTLLKNDCSCCNRKDTYTQRISRNILVEHFHLFNSLNVSILIYEYNFRF